MDRDNLGGARRRVITENGRSASTADVGHITADIESLNFDGRGVAHVDGKATFIDGALPGERVRFRYTSRRRRFDCGETIEVLRASPDRVDAACPHFGRCGGCSLQHLRPEAQILAKQRVLADALRHIGRVQPQSWFAPLVGPAWHYRRRARFGVRWLEKKGGTLVGFRERNRSFVSPLVTCPVLDERISNLLAPLKRLIDGLSAPHRIPQIEVAAGDESVALVLRHLVPLSERDRAALSDFARTHDVHILMQGGGLNAIDNLWPPHAPELRYRIPEFNVQLDFGPTDFVQINDALNRRMVSRAVELLEPTASDRVLDLFCGLGNFTIPLARHSGQVLGIEAEPALLDAARANAQRNGVDNVEFRQADLYGDNDSAEWRDFPANKLLLDPPRAGAIEVIRKLKTPLPDRIVYVSCLPSTLARDAAFLTTVLGYHLRSAGVMDMFPHTDHVESVALFTRGDDAH